MRPRVESYEDHDLGEVHVSNVRERELVDLSIMKPGNEGVKMRSVLEDEFYNFFKDVVCEWNPCYSEDGRWRYKWDDDIGPDVDFPAELVPDDFRGMSSEKRAQTLVSGKEPDRVNLRDLLDNVFAVEEAGR